MLQIVGAAGARQDARRFVLGRRFDAVRLNVVSHHFNRIKLGLLFFIGEPVVKGKSRVCFIHANHLSIHWFCGEFTN